MNGMLEVRIRTATRDTEDDRNQGRLIEGVGPVPIGIGTGPDVIWPGRAGRKSARVVCQKHCLNV